MAGLHKSPRQAASCADMTSDLEALSPAGNGSRLDSSCLELLNAREPHVNKELPVVRRITLIEDDGLTLNVNG